ncbi:MAG: glycoside hydrolase family 9 protein [Anaerolineaceae bacterium]
MKKPIFFQSILVLILIVMTACSSKQIATPVNSPSAQVPLLTATPTATKEPSLYVPPEIPGEVLYIPYPLAINVDGDLTDWEGIPAYYVDYGPSLSSDPAENGSFTFSVASDLQNFYITMQMPDRNIIAGKHGTEFWNEDSMEFYLNASGDLSATKYATNMFQINVNAADIGNTDPKALTITGVFSSDVPVTGYVFKTEKGWGFEATLAYDGMLKLEHGLEIGFQAQINGATTADRDVKLIWSKADSTDQSWEKPNLFGRALFFELGRTDIPEASVVQMISTATPTISPAMNKTLISVNQTGYLPSSQKIAILALDSEESQDWQFVNSSGEVLLSGKTLIKGMDTVSGDFIHLIDFSNYIQPGYGYQIISNEKKSPPFMISADLFEPLTKDAMAYFYHNRSGTPIESKFVGDQWARPAGHISDNQVTCYKGQDADGNTWPGCNYTLDVAGGWYDAGDFGKYVVNGGISVWTLMNLYEKFPDAFPDGSLAIPENENGISDLLDEARWEMEFLLSMQVPQGQPQAGMVHHKIHDESWAPIPMIPPTEVDNDNDSKLDGTGRYLFPPSTAATLNLAATAAVSARIWEVIDPEFSKQSLKAAEIAWSAAVDNPAIYAGNTPGQGGGNYDDNDVSDEFYWAAAELFITTGKDVYKDYLLASPHFGQVDSFDWGHTASLGTISLLSVANQLSAGQIAILKTNLLTFADEMLALQVKDGYSVLIKGEYPWGSNGLIMNNMILMGIAYDLTEDYQYLNAVRFCMDYIMGRNPVNKSFISGYGTYSMQHPHHRFWANDPDAGFPPPPAGALSGGPNATANDPVANNAGLISLPESKRYLDDIGSFTTNEVTINWNAPLVWISVYLNSHRQ